MVSRGGWRAELARFMEHDWTALLRSMDFLQGGEWSCKGELKEVAQRNIQICIVLLGGRAHGRGWTRGRA